MVTRRDYRAEAVFAAKSVLIELVHLLKKIGDAFASVDQWGPVAVADFDEIADPEDRALRQRDSFERVNMLLERLRMHG
jgi:hypothetical protein